MKKEKELTIKNRLGLHARAAAKFADTATKYKSEIKVSKDGIEVNGKSIMGLLTLIAEKGSKIMVSAEGPDAEDAISALEELVEDMFGEES